MKLRIVRLAMWQYNQKKCYGFHCSEWQDFVKDCDERYGCHPWDIGAANKDVSYGFAAKWLDVAVGSLLTKGKSGVIYER
jgi:hypothetical protein